MGPSLWLLRRFDGGAAGLRGMAAPASPLPVGEGRGEGVPGAPALEDALILAFSHGEKERGSGGVPLIEPLWG